MFSYTLVTNTGGKIGIKIITNNKLWMEEEAICHLQKISEFKGVKDVVGLPDLHVGKVPVGMSVKTKGIIYSFFIGNDIGCGMTLFNTNIKLKKFNMEKYYKKLEGTHIVGKYSIGGGNHFAEYQMIEKIYNKEYGKQLNLQKDYLFMLIHSGSRQLGDDIYRDYASLEGLQADSLDYIEYMARHQEAVEFARENRINIANILMDKMRIKYNNQLIVDSVHNYLE